MPSRTGQYGRWLATVLPSRKRDGRRFARAYLPALDKLGDPAPAVRVGALRALEALADSDPRHRQAVVDVLCAYLRSPVEGDVVVERTAQQILAAHLLPTAGDSFWAGVRLDLTAAKLTDFDLSNCRVDGGIRADLAVFRGATRLRGTVVGAEAIWHGAVFADHVWMERAVFMGPCHFDAAVFEADAWFGETTFAQSTSFAAATVRGHAWFGRAEFRGQLDFGSAVFHRSVGLRGAMLHVRPGLKGTIFHGPARVSRRDDRWNVIASGWRVRVDPDNESVGDLIPKGQPAESTV
jgi:hypothetical protein